MCCWESVQSLYQSFFAISGKLLFIPLEFPEKKDHPDLSLLLFAALQCVAQ